MDRGVIRSQRLAAVECGGVRFATSPHYFGKATGRAWCCARVGRQTREGGPEAIKLKSAHGSAHETTSARSARYIYHYVAA